MYPIQTGISTNVFGDPAEIATLVRRLSKAFSVIEIVLEHSARRLFDERRSLWPTQRRELLDLKQEHGLTYVMHAPYLGPYTELAHGTKAVRRASVAYLSRCLDEAFLLGIRLVTIRQRALERGAYGIEHRSFDALASSLEILRMHATALDIELSLEWGARDDPADPSLSEAQKRLLHDEIGIGATLNIMDNHALDPDFDEHQYCRNILQSLPYVQHVHFSDLQDTHLLQLLLGRRQFVYMDLVTALRHSGYRGHFVIEEGRRDFVRPCDLNQGRSSVKRPAAEVM
ncbi:hypothetical protein WJ69_26200 [Burkholderia ubonensis]|uniref:sugar phosphate isomerase/epimerase family protein n=1 Tax=Burkholderia ubonensis TaxID=101571 RepID=UPI0007597808|nr:TIM barrel protein [Burkholderia ubonensis]KVO04091.1 hypothetical protein WJ69_26200 [Burkholderia ubonensis]